MVPAFARRLDNNVDFQLLAEPKFLALLFVSFRICSGMQTAKENEVVQLNIFIKHLTLTSDEDAHEVRGSY